jgi:hypothetical protein
VASVPQTLTKITDTLFNVSFWTRAAFIFVGLGLVFIGTRALLTGDSVQVGPDAEYGTAESGDADMPADKSGGDAKASAGSTAKKSFGKTAEADAGEAAEVA